MFRTAQRNWEYGYAGKDEPSVDEIAVVEDFGCAQWGSIQPGSITMDSVLRMAQPNISLCYSNDDSNPSFGGLFSQDINLKVARLQVSPRKRRPERKDPTLGVDEEEEVVGQVKAICLQKNR
ncbi:hypothetical protein GLAREA_00200 [Glarea lozoyensis ATCC 20868]|uniref:Uncharacterized protein n=1 Tax=Glarea lozoyensis (strain ATCC 20868 / MF5171) TaxID=1116229 RepID=S3CRE3_GLAL2|nr:uncharacterized protein GLAREA_00200 [Glarea lozoyensis ATCC 20868]EPE29042.1 hypothetical protein GLAREA_00200 [Glarea lozoyensis ATCC 20868]